VVPDGEETMKKHTSFCPQCGVAIDHQIKDGQEGYSPCPNCHALLKTTGGPFFEAVDIKDVPMAVAAQYKRFLDEIMSRQLAQAKEAGAKKIVVTK
jgi:hypothetical protein